MPRTTITPPIKHRRVNAAQLVRFALAGLVLMAGALAVHAAPAAKEQPSPPEILRDLSKLPDETRRMVAAILSAASSGDVEALRGAIEMNEIPPVFASKKPADPYSHWREQSGDGEGREVLAAIIEIFRAGFVKKPDGKNGDLYVWPYFAETPLSSLTSGQQVELLTLVPAAEAKKMMSAGKYTHFRIGISSKGVWHFFDKAE
jgi:hypothetical protein